MNPRWIFAMAAPWVGLVLPHTASAQETPVEKREWSVEIHLSATLAAAENDQLVCVPQTKIWRVFAVKQVLPHTADCKAGQEIVHFKTDAIDAAIAQTRREIELLGAEKSQAVQEADELAILRLRTEQHLQNLLHDRALMVLTASADGTFFHGFFRNGRWQGLEIENPSTREGGLVPGAVIGSWAATNRQPCLIAALDAEQAAMLAVGARGVAMIREKSLHPVPVEVKWISLTPSPDATRSAKLAFLAPLPVTAIPGRPVELRIAAAHRDAAMVLPIQALSRDDNGWHVNIRLADGTSARRSVKTGLCNQTEVEIIDGLEVGQVVVCPPPP